MCRSVLFSMALIFNEGLILSNIMEFLCIEDAIKLHCVSDLHQTIYDSIENKKFQKADNFVVQVCELISDFNKAIGTQTKKLDALFDHLLLNRWFIDYEKFALFATATEKKLFELVFGDWYNHQALYYLGELFNVHVNADISHEWLQNRDGEIFYLT